MRNTINSLFEKEGIQPISYRISADYGSLELAESRFSRDRDFFGPTMNLCSKMNSKATPNSIVIGGNLHQVIKKLHSGKDFEFHENLRIVHRIKTELSYLSVVPIDFDYRLKHEELKNLIVDQQFNRKQSVQVFDRMRSSTKEPSKLRLDDRILGNIMMVDDQPDVLFTFRSFLEGQGFKVYCFTDPTIALRQFAKEDPSKYRSCGNGYSYASAERFTIIPKA